MKRDAGGRSARERGGPPVCLPRSLPRRLLREGTGADERPWPAALRRGGGKAAAAPSSSPALSPRWEGELRAGLGACYRWVSPGKAGAGRRRPPARRRPAPAGPDPFHIPQWGEKNPPRFVPEAEWDRGGKRPLPLSQAGGAVGSRFPEGRGFWVFFFVVVGILALR